MTTATATQAPISNSIGKVGGGGGGGGGSGFGGGAADSGRRKGGGGVPQRAKEAQKRPQGVPPEAELRTARHALREHEDEEVLLLEEGEE